MLKLKTIAIILFYAGLVVLNIFVVKLALTAHIK
jgi:hypothetical protein